MKQSEGGLIRKFSDGSQPIENFGNWRIARLVFRLLSFSVASGCALFRAHEKAFAQSEFIFPSTVQVSGGSLTGSVAATISVGRKSRSSSCGDTGGCQPKLQ
jgi:hypothetical protein